MNSESILQLDTHQNLNLSEESEMISDVVRQVEPSFSRILIIDDEPFNLMSLMAIFKQAAKRMGLKEDALDGVIDQANDGQVGLRMATELIAL